jgi:hypothetical protein
MNMLFLRDKLVMNPQLEKVLDFQSLINKIKGLIRFESKNFNKMRGELENYFKSRV